MNKAPDRNRRSDRFLSCNSRREGSNRASRCPDGATRHRLQARGFSSNPHRFSSRDNRQKREGCPPAAPRFPPTTFPESSGVASASPHSSRDTSSRRRKSYGTVGKRLRYLLANGRLDMDKDRINGSIDQAKGGVK